MNPGTHNTYHERVSGDRLPSPPRHGRRYPKLLLPRHRGAYTGVLPRYRTHHAVAAPECTPCAGRGWCRCHAAILKLSSGVCGILPRGVSSSGGGATRRVSHRLTTELSVRGWLWSRVRRVERTPWQTMIHRMDSRLKINYKVISEV